MFPVLRHFRVLKNLPEAEGVFTLLLAPADEQPLFSFQAGQFAMLHLLNDDGTTWAKAAYSFATAPSDSTDTIEFGIKVSGDFTQRASRLTPGEIVGIQGPYGVFTLKTEDEPLVFLAAGIGITPLRSMIRDLLFKKDVRDLYVFYSDKNEACLAYRKEFEEFARQYSHFHFIPFLTRETSETWMGERGRITGEAVKRYLSTLQSAHYYMCGPVEFMNTLKEFLVGQGVDSKTQIQKEVF